MDQLPQSTPPHVSVPAPAPSAGPPHGSPSGSTLRMVRMLALLAVLMALLVLPPLVRRIQYASEFGKQRARMDVALAGLKELKVDSLSTASRWVAQAVGPAVVHINTTARSTTGRAVGDDGAGRQWPNFSHPPSPHQSVEGEGSGVIVDRDGYIVTNNHVIEGASAIRVGLSDGRRVDARVVGTDPMTDIAVLKIEESGLVAAGWGDSGDLETGDMVWAVGSPFGLDHSVTFGIVSAKGRQGMRQGGQFQDFLQTDAAVNPGNSGGPLVNIRGEIVGINTAIVGPSYRGISLAVPSGIARAVYDNIRSAGKVARAWLGVKLQDLTPIMARHFGLETVRGVVVVEVVPGTPAYRGRVRTGDVILEWNGQVVTSTNVLSRAVAATQIGSTARVKLVRDGEPIVVQVVVEERPARI